jgi:hypothetical protein
MKSANKNSTGRKKSSISKHKTVDMTTFHKDPLLGLFDESEANDLYARLNNSNSLSSFDTESLMECLDNLGPYNLMANLPPLEFPCSSETTLSHVISNAIFLIFGINLIIGDVAVRSDINKAGLQRGKKEKVAVATENGKKKVYQMEVILGNNHGRD